MTFVFMTDPATGRGALFEENGTSGDVADPNSVRNAPLNSPVGHLRKVRVHSDFDYYQVLSDTVVTVNHAAVAGVTVTIATTPTFVRYGQVVKTPITLVTHGLGYPPNYMIVSDDCLIGQSSRIQLTSSGGRMVSPFATTSTISLLDVGISTNAALVALSKTYRVIIFRAPIADSLYLLDWDPETGALILGKGKFRGALKTLRRTLLADASPFDIPLGRTTDIRNGVSRTVLADGTTTSDPRYNGRFTGSPSLQGTIE